MLRFAQDRRGGRRAAIAVIAVFCLLVPSVATAKTDFLRKYERSRLPRISSPKVHEIVLKNGIRCFLLEDHTLPLVKMSAIVRAGGIFDPPAMVGLAELTGTLLRSGGAGERTPQMFDAAVDGLGAHISASAGREMTVATAELLSKDLSRGAELFFDMLLSPMFDQKRLTVARAALRETLRRDADDPPRQAGIAFDQLVYGAQSPWARRPDAKTIARVTPMAIRDFHRRFFRPNNMLIAVAGDFKLRVVVKLIERLTATAVKEAIDFPDVPKVVLGYQPGWRNIVRPLTQSYIRTGHLSIKRHNPDKFALFLLSNILGGGNFKSRLMEDIRTKRGLAYSVWSDIDAGTDYGLFEISVNTRASEAGEVIGLLDEHVRRFSEAGDVTEEELEFAKQSVLTQLIFEFDSAFKIVTRRAKFFFYGYPSDYWRIYRERIASTTVDDIRRVAKKYLHPDGLKTVVVGPRIQAPTTKAGK